MAFNGVNLPHLWPYEKTPGLRLRQLRQMTVTVVTVGKSHMGLIDPRPGFFSPIH